MTVPCPFSAMMFAMARQQGFALQFAGERLQLDKEAWGGGVISLSFLWVLDDELAANYRDIHQESLGKFCIQLIFVNGRWIEQTCCSDHVWSILKEVFISVYL